MPAGFRISAMAGSIALLAGAAVSVSAQQEAPTPGKVLFDQRCAACHDARGFGTRILSRRLPEGQAELEKRENLASPYVAAVVRMGIGSMPPIRKAELSDADLALIAEHLERGE